MAEARKLRMGMVGGGPGAFIGPVHRIAAELDGKIELVAGAFSQSAERSREAGVRFQIDPARAYADYRQMIEAERKRADGIDFVAIVTPNHVHLPVALAALEAGIPVMSDKPATATYEEALKLEAAVRKSGLPYGLTHTYAGYAMVREARAMCAAGKLGAIRKVAVEYFQGWLSGPIETTGHKQAAWRADPAQSGAGRRHRRHRHARLSSARIHQRPEGDGDQRDVAHGGAGTPARRRLQRICAHEQRRGGHAGLLAGGRGRDERDCICASMARRARSTWRQQDPNRLIVKWLDRPEEIHHAAMSYLSADALAVARVPAGHPEGYLEAFAVLYREFADALIAWKQGKANPLPATLPGIEAGVRGHALHRARHREQPQGRLGGVLETASRH